MSSDTTPLTHHTTQPKVTWDLSLSACFFTMGDVRADVDQALGKRTRQEEEASKRLMSPIHSERHVRIVCIGAGASGLLFAYKL